MPELPALSLLKKDHNNTSSLTNTPTFSESLTYKHSTPKQPKQLTDQSTKLTNVTRNLDGFNYLSGGYDDLDYGDNSQLFDENDESNEDDDDNDMDFEFRDEELSNYSTQSKNIFKKIFTRNNYARLSDSDLSGYQQNIEPISLVKIKHLPVKKPLDQIQPQRSTSSSSGTSNSASIKVFNTKTGFQPVEQNKIEIINRSCESQQKVSYKQPLTKLPVFNFGKQAASIEPAPSQMYRQHQAGSIKMRIIPLVKRRSNTCDLANMTHNSYKNQYTFKRHLATNESGNLFYYSPKHLSHLSQNWHSIASVVLNTLKILIC